MHFFCELTNLPTEAIGFGPIEYDNTVDPPTFEKVFNIGSKFTLTQKIKACACVTGKMIVQQAVDNNLVNLIIKPNDQLEIKSVFVKYYIYRGIRRDSFFSGSNVTPQATSNTELITKFWTNWNATAPHANPPTKREFGYDQTLPFGTDVEGVFIGSQAGVDAIDVTEGEWIGDFDITATGEYAVFEIITDTDNFNIEYDPGVNAITKKGLNVSYLQRGSDLNIDVIGMMESNNTEEFNIKVKREQILSYIDPAAFYGLHYGKKVKISTFDASTGARIINREEKTTTDIYEMMLVKFLNKNRVYIDIRSEHGYSYNYYQNYNSVGDDNILRYKIQDPDNVTPPIFIDHTYSISKWPIFYENICNSRDTVNKTKVQVKTKDNARPLIFLDEQGFWKNNKKKTSKYIPEEDILNTSDPLFWSHEITLRFPNYRPLATAVVKLNVAHYIKLHYYKQENTILSPGLTIVRESDLDQIFGKLELTEDTASLPELGQVQSNKYNYIKGQYFSYNALPQLFKEVNNIIFLTKLYESHIQSEDFYPQISPIKVLNPKELSGNKFFPQDIQFQKIKIYDGGDEIHALDLPVYNENKGVTNKENLFMLCMTDAELVLLSTSADTEGISKFHKRRIVLNQVPGNSPANEITYQKYEINIVGLKADGTAARTVTTGIFVYTLNGYLFNSKDYGFANAMPFVSVDGGTLETNRYIGVWEYSAPVLSPALHPTGVVIVPDKDGNDFLEEENVELIGVVHYPSDVITGELNPTSSYPLVVICHGNGQRYNQYLNISRHFARNGFIVTTINCLYFFGPNETSLQSTGVLLSPYTHLFFNNLDYFVYCNDPSFPSEYQTIAIIKLDVYGNPIVVAGDYIFKKQSWILGTDFTIDIPNEKITFLTPKAKGQYKHDMGGLGRANMIYNHLEIVKKKFLANVQNKIAIMGHSRGGEAVVKAANELLNPSSNIFTDYPYLLSSGIGGPNTLKAVISLAPTDQYPDPNKEILDRNVPFMMMYGSSDYDVNGQFQANNPASIMETGFSIYDRAVNQEKTMIFAYRATHNGFITNNAPDIFAATNYGVVVDPKSLKSEFVQRGISYAYMNAMLRKYVHGETNWEDYFSGQKIPASINHDEVYTQFEKETSLNKHIIYASSDTPGLLLIDVNYNGTSANLKKGELRANDGVNLANLASTGTSPHDNKGVTLLWEGDKKLWFKFFGQNVSAYQKLNFRIANGSRGTVLKGMQVGLSDGSEMKYLPVANLSPPDKREDLQRFDADSNSHIIFPTKISMQTIRLSLADYQSQGIDLTNIKKIEFMFPAGAGGKVTIDNIMFTV